MFEQATYFTKLNHTLDYITKSARPNEFTKLKLTFPDLRRDNDHISGRMLVSTSRVNTVEIYEQPHGDFYLPIIDLTALVRELIQLYRYPNANVHLQLKPELVLVYEPIEQMRYKLEISISELSVFDIARLIEQDTHLERVLLDKLVTVSVQRASGFAMPIDRHTGIDKNAESVKFGMLEPTSTFEDTMSAYQQTSDADLNTSIENLYKDYMIKAGVDENGVPVHNQLNTYRGTSTEPQLRTPHKLSGNITSGPVLADNLGDLLATDIAVAQAHVNSAKNTKLEDIPVVEEVADLQMPEGMREYLDDANDREFMKNMNMMSSFLQPVDVSSPLQDDFVTATSTLASKVEHDLPTSVVSGDGFILSDTNILLSDSSTKEVQHLQIADEVLTTEGPAELVAPTEEITDTFKTDEGAELADALFDEPIEVGAYDEVVPDLTPQPKRPKK